jgi:hypothetical protein
MHGENNNPRAGWAYILATEARSLSISRANLWTDDCLEELIARDLEVRFNRTDLADEEDATEDEETKKEEETEETA